MDQLVDAEGWMGVVGKVGWKTRVAVCGLDNFSTVSMNFKMHW